MSPKTFTLDEVKTHNTSKSLWVAIHGKVYDVSKFIFEHPGGEEILIDQGGQDATQAFEDIGHSEDARHLLSDFFIGELVSSKEEKNSNNEPKMAEKKPAEKPVSTTTNGISNYLPLLVFCVTTAALAAYIYL